MHKAFPRESSTVRSTKHHANVADTIKNTIDEIRASIDETERQYKQHVTNRRIQNPRVFTAADTELLSIQESDMASKAKQELARVRQTEASLLIVKHKDEEAIEQELKNRILLAKKQFQKRNQFIQGLTNLMTAGPSFLRHGYCLFGEVLYASMLTDESYAIFSNENTLEVWFDPPKGDCDLRQLVNLSIPGILCVTEIARQKLEFDMSQIDVPIPDRLKRDSVVNHHRDHNVPTVGKISTKRTIIQQEQLRESMSTYMVAWTKLSTME
jgi:hypothetical protein